ARFDLVVVSRYLQRDLFADLQASIVPGGAVIYETFTINQRALGRPPASADHLLEPDELRRRFDGFEVLFYEEVTDPDALARLVARSRS
ncbi:MAG: Methyltransferase type 12, partial [Acidobacteria bacterium]|nr:Methyltransferase type 12 [Acidobacteriota bacterium]